MNEWGQTNVGVCIWIDDPGDWDEQKWASHRDGRSGATLEDDDSAVRGETFSLPGSQSGVGVGRTARDDP